MKDIQNIIAKEKGYPNWDVMYCWICRNGERPDVVAQQIEALMTEVAHKYTMGMINLYVSSNLFFEHKQKMGLFEYINKWYYENK